VFFHFENTPFQNGRVFCLLLTPAFFQARFNPLPGKAFSRIHAGIPKEAPVLVLVPHGRPGVKRFPDRCVGGNDPDWSFIHRVPVIQHLKFKP
jgi:hypothetical protein